MYTILFAYNVSDSARTRFEKRYSSFLYFIAFIFCHSCWYLSRMCASDWERERKEKCKKATMIFWASPSFLFSHLKIFVSSPFYFTSPSSSFLSIFHVFFFKNVILFLFFSCPSLPSLWLHFVASHGFPPIALPWLWHVHTQKVWYILFPKISHLHRLVVLF